MKAHRIALVLTAVTLLLLAAEAAASHYPSPEIAWSRREYVDFLFAHKFDNSALPHLRTPEARRLFERIVDEDNLRRVEASALPRPQKLQQMMMILGVMGDIRADYNYAVLVGEPLQEELVRVQSFNLAAIAAAIRIAAPMRTETPTATALKTTLFGTVTSLSERSVYSNQQITALAEAIGRHYQIISSVLTASDKRDLADRIGALNSTEQDPGVRQSFSGLLRLIASSEQ